ncbi:MAG TPA: glucose 1-dehydrogenase [Arenicellales bacterium]|nr:glucose 1-dehydrogenase [Arenicellales bacterium]
MDLPRTPSFRLDGRKALVTGAGRGIGLAAASALADAGADVCLLARTETEVSAVAEALCARGDAATAFAIDVTDTAAMTQLISQQGPFQVLVNNAGTNRPAPCIDHTETDYDDVMALNVKSVYFTTRAVARGLVAADLEGSIINISSTMGHVGGPGRTVYCASKHAVEGFTKALAWELGESGIRVNTLCPTFIETPMTEPMLEDKTFKDRVLSQIVLGRLGQVEDVMGAVVYLASDESRLVTGSALMVDGGWTAA